MKKLVFATAMALAGMSLVSARALRAQDSGQSIQIQDPAEFNAYQDASTQTDPAQKCSALESFNKTYPQSVAKKTVLDQMIDCYAATNNPDGVVRAAGLLLQIDPNYMKAIFYSVSFKKQQCSKSLDATGAATDTQTCDDMGALAQRCLAAAKPTGMSDDDWKKLTANAYPICHSAIAFDDAVSKAPTWPSWQANQTVAVGYIISDGVHLQKVTTAGLTGTSKPTFTETVDGVLTETGCATAPCAAWTDLGAGPAKDYPGAIKEYTTELNLYSLADCSKPGSCLADTLQLAQAYTKPGPSRDIVKAVWFYARAWNYAPPAYKTQIEPQLEYWYKRYHGTLDGDAAIKQQIDAIKTQAQATLFPPASFTITPAPSPADLAHKAYTSGDPTKLNLEDKEFILANGSKADADGLWALLKGQQTPVPGVVIADPATVLKISATTLASPKAKDFVVKLTTPGPCASVPPAPSELKIKDAQAYILANGVKADTDAMGDILTETPAHLKKLSIEPAVAAINVAVTQDAKDAHTADFTVNLKEPASCKETPAAGTELKLQPAQELDGTYDTYTQVAAQGSTAASAQIVLRDGFLQAEQKKTAPAHHAPAKPAAGHHG